MGITVRHITKRFGDFVALDDVDVEVGSGHLTALLGPSGGGKSTLLRIIAGLESRTPARCSSTASTRPECRRSGATSASCSSTTRRSSTCRCTATSRSGSRSASGRKAEIRERVHELLELVHLEQFADRLPSQLSGGQRQRMALARALAVEPNVLLLDEPFGALDTKVRKELRDWLRRLHDEVHVTTIFVTHDQEEALEVSDELVVINHGRIEQVGSPATLYDHPANDFVMGFLGPVTRLGRRLVRPHDIDVFPAATANAVEAVRAPAAAHRVRGSSRAARSRHRAVGSADAGPSRFSGATSGRHGVAPAGPGRVDPRGVVTPVGGSPQSR